MCCRRFVSLLLATWLSITAVADESKTTELANGDEKLEAIARRLPPAKPQDVRPVAQGALYEVKVGGSFVYVTSDGRYMVAGDLFELGSTLNLSELGRREFRKKEIASVSDSETIVFEPSEAAAHTITVFTDPDCTFCRKFHSEIAEINKLGIRVRYVAFPRTGPGSDAWKKSEAIWCAKDRAAAMTWAQLGKVQLSSECKSPVARHYDLGTRIGLQGTPLILTNDGAQIGGYLPPEGLKQRLEELSRLQR